MRTFAILPLVFILLYSCIGTDFTDELIGEDLSEAIIEESEASIVVGASFQLNFRFIGINGQESQADWTFVSSDVSIAEVDNAGLISAAATGQTWITGTANSFFMDSVLVTVVGDSNEIAMVSISSPSMSLMVDSTLQFTATVRNLRGEVISNAPVTWNSTQIQVGTIDSTGLLTGISEGTTQITASTSGISSAAISIDISSQAGRSGTFGGVNGYSVSGTATLIGITGNATLELGADFASQSGPGLRVYLGKNANNVNGGVDLGALMSGSGAQSYSLPSGTNPADFTHVFIYCQPFSVPFGVAELN